MTSHASSLASPSTQMDSAETGCHSANTAAVDWHAIARSTPAKVRADSALCSPRDLLADVQARLDHAEAGCHAAKQMREEATRTGRYRDAQQMADEVAAEVLTAAQLMARLMVRPLTLDDATEAMRLRMAAYVSSFEGWM